jgi:hypothetical protein
MSMDPWPTPDPAVYAIGDEVQITVHEVFESVVGNIVTLYGTVITAVDVPFIGWMYQLELNGHKTESLWPEGALRRRTVSPVYSETMN